jgi:hypothetical protein
MTKRVLLLTALALALVVPAVSLADDGSSSGGAPPAAAAPGNRAGRIVQRLGNRLERRFQVFSSHCLVASPAERCAKVAGHLAKRLERLQERLRKVEARIKAKCAEAKPPARCANADTVTAAIDDLLAKLASDEAAVTKAFPSTGSA